MRGFLRRLYGPAVLLAASCAAPSDESEGVHGRGCAPVAVVAGRVVDARGRGALVAMRYSAGALALAAYDSDPDGRYAHRLHPSGSGTGTHVDVMPLDVGIGGTTGAWIPALPWWSPPSPPCDDAAPPDTFRLDLQLPPLRRPAG